MTTTPTDSQTAATRPQYTRNVLAQMLAVFLLLIGVAAWQWEVLQEIYLKNQVNAIGWVINGGIMLLFFCGLAVLVGRFFEYRAQESAIDKILANLRDDLQPLLGIDAKSLLAERFNTLQELTRQHATINQNALAATLLAAESSRNSFPKFVHNVLILTGVFGTIISLSLSLLGASDMIHGAAPAVAGETSGLGTMIFGMSTALSTTMTAILAYLIFGYFYIKLTDTQTYIVSRIEEVTATTLLPHLRISSSPVKEYADSVRRASELIERFDQSQQKYEGAIVTLIDTTKSLSDKLDAGASAEAGEQAKLQTALLQLGEQQHRIAEENRVLLTQAVGLLREGFRLRRQ